MKLTNNHNPRERERERESKLPRLIIQFIKKESHKPFFYASLFFALLLLLTVIYQLAFSWNPPTAGAPGPSGQTLYSDTNRNIGIGTLYPSVKLEIYSTSSDSILKLSRQSATSTLFKLGTDSAFVINSNGADRLTISSTGNVGIGTTAPNSKLEVAGTIHSTTGGIKFPDGTTQTTSAGVVSSRKICLENEYCSGTPKICAYFRNTSGVVSADDYSVSFGSWSNPQCGLSGSGWHVDNIDSCSIDSGLKQLSCAFVIVE